MPYVGHNRLAILGTFERPGEEDVWTIGLNFGGDLAPERANPSLNDQIASVISTWHIAAGGLRNKTSQGTKIVGFKWNAIGPNGKYVTPESPNEYVYSTPLIGNISAKMPTQVAMTVSLYTRLKGKRYRGRVYLPCDSLTIGTDWTVSSANATPVASSFASLIGDLNNLFGPWQTGFGHCVVASSYGVNTPVEQVRVGNILDTQRRRRNRLTETYYTADIP